KRIDGILRRLRVIRPRFLLGLHFVDELLARIRRVAARNRDIHGAKTALKRVFPIPADLSMLAFMRVEGPAHASPRADFGVPMGALRRRPFGSIDGTAYRDGQLRVSFAV